MDTTVDSTLLDPAALKVRMAAETEARALLSEYIKHNLKDGTDYGSIVVGSNTSKPSLFKPGAEKMTLLLQLRPHFGADRATLAMAGNPPGLFAYICRLIHTPTGVVIGEGRGTAALSEKQKWTVNSAVKIAEKRAQVDAVLRVAGLSDFFTQDLEDSADADHAQPRQERASAPHSVTAGERERVAAGAERAPVVPATGSTATEKQIGFIKRVAHEKRKWAEPQVVEEARRLFGKGLQELNRAEASQFIDMLQADQAA